MTSRKPTKINQVLQKWPRGTVATQEWLNRMGFSSKLANWHVKSGWLVRFGARAFAQPGDRVDWLGGLWLAGAFPSSFALTFATQDYLI